METMIGAAGRDVDRDVAVKAYAAIGRIRTQGSPLAVEADLILDGAASGEALPVADPERLPSSKVRDLPGADRGTTLRQQAGPGGKG
jgi:hypothetical protein